MTSYEEARRCSCQSKTKYRTPAKARKALRYRMALGAGKLSVYLCRFCSFYHIGHEITPERSRLLDRLAKNPHA